MANDETNPFGDEGEEQNEVVTEGKSIEEMSPEELMSLAQQKQQEREAAEVSQGTTVTGDDFDEEEFEDEVTHFEYFAMTVVVPESGLGTALAPPPRKQGSEPWTVDQVVSARGFAYIVWVREVVGEAPVYDAPAQSVAPPAQPQAMVPGNVPPQRPMVGGALPQVSHGQLSDAQQAAASVPSRPPTPDELARVRENNATRNGAPPPQGQTVAPVGAGLAEVVVHDRGTHPQG